jgi:hypothetical protein
MNMWKLILNSKILPESFRTKKDAELEIINREGLLRVLGVKYEYRIKKI